MSDFEDDDDDFGDGDAEEWMNDDQEDYDFDYEDEDEDDAPDEDDPVVEMQNQYYLAKQNMEDEPDEAIKGFKKVLELESEIGEKGDWGFKALKQSVKLHFRSKNQQEMMDTYSSMLKYIKSAVTRNDSEKAIRSILEEISTSSNMDMLQAFYETTLTALQEAKNERLWFKTNLNLGKLWYDRGEYTKLAKILRELHKSCQKPDGSDDMKKGTQLLEVYALEIQMYTATKNTKLLKELYEKSLQIRSAIPHPRIMAVIRECGGKMHMTENNWDSAFTDFFEAFKNYDEAGSPRRIQCLNYMVLANMLRGQPVSVFDSQEAKSYQNDPQILAMTSLVSAYDMKDIRGFEKILKDNRKSIMEDPFIRAHIEDLLRSIRTGFLVKLLQPYTRVRIPYIADELNVDEAEVESLLVSLILDCKIDGRIDQVNKQLILAERGDEGHRYRALNKWQDQLKGLSKTVHGKMTNT